MLSHRIERCTLELRDDGVIYVHGPRGYTLLRICGVPSNPPVPSPTFMLDITLKFQKLAAHTFNWMARPFGAEEPS